MTVPLTTRLITRKFRIYNAEQFKGAFDESSSEYLYMFIGRVHPWPDNEVPPPLVQSIDVTEYDPWIDMLAAKKISANDMSLVVPRIDWIADRVYVQYNNQTNVDIQGNAANYVFTSSGNVYKCIFNNRGSLSTVEPTGVNTVMFDTEDGYKWKFMYTISGAEALKFVTPHFIPVETITIDDASAQFSVQEAAVDGAIHVINVTANGTNYIERRNTVAAGTNDPRVIILDSGASSVDNFFTGQSIFISDGLGAGQIRNIVNYVGELRQVTVDADFVITPDSSSSFHVSPKITIIGDGINATAFADVETGQIKQINMANIGSNYSKAKVLITGSQGSGATAIPTISPPGGHGSDPVSELYGHNLMLSVRFDGTEDNTFPPDNEFRVVGLIANPLLTSNGALAEDISYNQTTRLSVVNFSGSLVLDEIINGQNSGATARVAYFTSNTSSGIIEEVNVVAIDGIFLNETITGNTSGATGNIALIVSGDLLPYNGSILHLENIPPSGRVSDQIEDIKLTLQY